MLAGAIKLKIWIFSKNLGNSEPFFHVSEDCLIVARLQKSAYFS